MAKVELVIMARAFTETMGRTFSESEKTAEICDWYLERTNADKEMFRLAECGEYHSVSYPVTSETLPGKVLADALHFAWRAVCLDREETEEKRGW